MLDTRAAEVVNDLTLEPDGPAGGGPPLADVPDQLAVGVKDAGAVEPTGLPAPLDHAGELAEHGNRTRLLVLRELGRQADDALVPEVVPPLEPSGLTDAPPPC